MSVRVRPLAHAPLTVQGDSGGRETGFAEGVSDCFSGNLQ